jgi:hypothetical protein
MRTVLLMYLNSPAGLRAARLSAYTEVDRTITTSDGKFDFVVPVELYPGRLVIVWKGNPTVPLFRPNGTQIEENGALDPGMMANLTATSVTSQSSVVAITISEGLASTTLIPNEVSTSAGIAATTTESNSHTVSPTPIVSTTEFKSTSATETAMTKITSTETKSSAIKTSTTSETETSTTSSLSGFIQGLAAVDCIPYCRAYRFLLSGAAKTSSTSFTSTTTFVPGEAFLVAYGYTGGPASMGGGEAKNSPLFPAKDSYNTTTPLINITNTFNNAMASSSITVFNEMKGGVVTMNDTYLKFRFTHTLHRSAGEWPATGFYYYGQAGGDVVINSNPWSNTDIKITVMSIDHSLTAPGQKLKSAISYWPNIGPNFDLWPTEIMVEDYGGELDSSPETPGTFPKSFTYNNVTPGYWGIVFTSLYHVPVHTETTTVITYEMELFMTM